VTLRIGTLGCARITPGALLRPARKLAGVEVTAVAARDPQRAERWARRHRVGRVHTTYADLIADPSIDAVYVPLPNSLHAEWTVRALEAGKHVLCEKPLASHEREAKLMADSALAADRIGMEAFHYRYHPLAARIGEIVRSGELGEVRRIDIVMSIPLLLPGDIRWDPVLAGGTAMDLGCYAVNMARFLAGAEPDVRTAEGSLTRRGVDRNFTATLAFPQDVVARIRCSMLGPPFARLAVTGTKGELRVINPTVPQLFYRLEVKTGGVQRRERVADGTTYGHQLEAFAEAVRTGDSPVTDFADGVRNMRVIDSIRAIVGVRLPS
jgi:predicted dehydrogenase